MILLFFSGYSRAGAALVQRFVSRLFGTYQNT